jgi:hypothetical protein
MATTEDGASCPWSEVLNLSNIFVNSLPSFVLDISTVSEPLTIDLDTHEFVFSTSDDSIVGGPYTFDF